MRYFDGQEVRIGDVVGMGDAKGGVVVCDIGSGTYTPEHPESQWGYLNKGLMINFPRDGLIYYGDELEEDVHPISRGHCSGCKVVLSTSNSLS